MNLANLHWYDVLLVIIVFVMFYTSIRKLQKNAKNGGGCGGSCSGCSVQNCPSKKLTKNNNYPKNPFKEKSFEWIFLVKYKFSELIKTVGLCPTTLRFFEKNRVKLLSKRNYIAFFGNPFAIFLKPSLGGRQTPQSLHDSSPFMGA